MIMKAASFVSSLISLALLAGCSSGGGYDPETAKEAANEMREFIRGEVADPARRDSLITLVDRYENKVHDLNDHLQQFLHDLATLNSDYEATREQFADLGGTFTSSRRPHQDQLIAIVLEMRKMSTPDEWEDLAELERDAMKAMLQRERVKSLPKG